MNMKKCIFIICVLIMLLSIASVSANENITYDILDNNNEVDISTSDDCTNSLKQDSQWIEEENITNVADNLNQMENVMSSSSDDTF